MSRRKFVLEAIDPATECVVMEVAFEVENPKELSALVGVDPKGFDPRMEYRLDQSDFVRVKNHFELEFEPGDLPRFRTVLFALPEQQWRIDAYLLLKKTSHRSGWSEGFERMEGSLLGYEDWRNDVFVRTLFRRAGTSSDSSDDEG